MPVIVENNLTDKLKSQHFYKYMRKMIKEKKKIHLYFDLKKTNGIKFLNKKTNNHSIFINGCKFHLNNNSKYYFITYKSLNPNLSPKPSITEYKINKLFEVFNYKEEYKINEDGFILILINNLKEFFCNDFKCNINSYINNLVENIRKYSNRKIVLRFHPKNNNYKFKIIDKNMIIDQQTKITVLKDNCYCVFIQNTKLTFDFVSSGVPIMEMNLIKYNYFNNIGIKIDQIENIKNLNDNNLLPDRKNFLLHYFPFIFFNDEFVKKSMIIRLLTSFGLKNYLLDKYVK